MNHVYKLLKIDLTGSVLFEVTLKSLSCGSIIYMSYKSYKELYQKETLEVLT